MRIGCGAVRFLVCVLMIMPVAGAKAQPASNAAAQAALYKTIAALDTKLFEAYNRCDIATLSTMVADDLEFYHDQTGLAVGRTPFLESTRKYICGKVRRELRAGSMEVHMLKGYGAVEIGSHSFSHPGHETEEGAGEAKFVMLWQNKDDTWKLTRVISYDHGRAAEQP